MRDWRVYLTACVLFFVAACSPDIGDPVVSGLPQTTSTTTTTQVPYVPAPTTTTTTTTIPPTTTTTEPQVIAAAASPPQEHIATGTIWDQLGACETGRGGPAEWDYGIGYRWGSQLYDGGLQFHPDTWTGFGGTEFAPRAYLATREQQIVVAERVQASQGWGAWPACAKKLGLL